MLRKPIPGESLTNPPRSFPWERPPEISDPEEALEFHLKALTEPERAKNMALLLERGIDIQTLTSGYLRAAVSRGLHNIDTSLAVAPVIHEHIRGIAKGAGIDADDGFVDKEAQSETEAYVQRMRARKAVTNRTPYEPEEATPEPLPEEPRGISRRSLKLEE